MLDMFVKARKLATVVGGAASIFLMPAIGSWDAALNQTFRYPSANLGFSSVAWADTPVQYVPPSRGTPKNSVGAGSRGCPQSVPVTLALLVPNDHNGQTVSGHPTFSWYMSDKTSVPVEFALVEPGVAKPVFVKQMQVSQAGIMQVQLPNELPELATGKKYRWSVSQICDSNRPSNNVFVQSWVERVSPNSELSQKLATVKTEDSSLQAVRERARIYAQAGLWYDALQALSTGYTANPNDPSIKADFLALLAQGGLTQISAIERLAQL